MASGENWMHSAIVVNSTRRSTQRKRGKFRMVEYRTLKTMFNPAIAKQLRDEKKDLQLKKNNNEDPTTYWMQHPDLPGKEELVGHGWA